MKFGVGFLSSILLALAVGPALAAVEFKEAEITTIKNLVEHDPGTGAAPAKVNEKIKEKSKVSTAAASMAELTFADTSITRMGANTQFSFQSKERLVKLEQGTVLIHTPPGNGGAKVEAGGVTAAVTGTTFMASRDVSGNTMFVLLEGQGGLKITVGNSTTVIRPGQAASVGADAVKEAKSSSPADAGTAGGPAASPAADEKKPGGTGGSGQGPSAAASAGGGEGGGTPPPSSAPKIQVFDIDVKRVVSTTPLIQEFKNELPSTAKIEKTIEVQQTAVKEGKLEKLEVEVVAVKNKDGDLLVGAPKVEKEEMVVVNKKIDIVAAGKGGDGLDIETAAGPGAGPGPQGNAPAPVPTPIVGQAPPPPSTTTTVIGQIAGSTTATAQVGPSALDVTVSGGLIRASLDRASILGRNVSFTVPGFNWLTLSPSTAAIPAGATSTGNLAMNLGNAAAFFPGWDASYGLRPITLSAVSGDLSDSVLTTDLWPTAAIQSANPARQLTSAPTRLAELAALDAFFYFKGRAAGVTEGPAQYFSSLGTTPLSLADIDANPSSWALRLYAAQDFDFFAARNLTATTGVFNPDYPGMLTSPQWVIFGQTVSWNANTGTIWRNLSNPLLNTSSLGYRATTLNPDYWTYDGTQRALGNFAFWDDASTASLLSNGSPSISSAVDINLSGLSRMNLVGGSGGIQISGLDLSSGGASVEIQSIGDLQLQASRVQTGAGNELRLESAGKVKLGAATAGTAVPTATQANENQVRLEGAGTGSAPNLAVIRTGNSFEMRNVSISGFSRVELDGVSSPDSAGNRTVTGRVLLNANAVLTAGSTAHLKIRELVGAAVNADSKIQMMALDGSGQLAGTMVAGLEGAAERVRLPVEALRDGSGNVIADTHQVDLAARRIEFQNLNIAAMNSITARANTILVQNSFMTVVQSGGFISMYVGSGQVNPTYGTVLDGKLNFAGAANVFQIGGNNFNVSNQADLNANLGVNILEQTQHLGIPQPGKLNVFSL